MPGVQKIPTPRKGAIESLALRIDHHAAAPRVVYALGDLADLESNLKTRFCGGGVFAQIGTVDFQPEPLGALAQGHKLGFRECSHRRLLGYWRGRRFRRPPSKKSLSARLRQSVSQDEGASTYSPHLGHSANCGTSRRIPADTSGFKNPGTALNADLLDAADTL